MALLKHPLDAPRARRLQGSPCRARLGDRRVPRTSTSAAGSMASKPRLREAEETRLRRPWRHGRCCACCRRTWPAPTTCFNALGVRLRALLLTVYASRGEQPCASSPPRTRRWPRRWSRSRRRRTAASGHPQLYWERRASRGATSSPASSIRSCRTSQIPPATTPISTAGWSSKRERAPARRRASAPLHLGPVRGAPAAGRRHDPGLAQRRHMAGSRPIPDPGSTGRCARSWGCRRRRKSIGYAAHDFTSLLGAPKRLSHARREDRRRADGALALAAAACRRCLAGLGFHEALQPRAAVAGWARARDAWPIRGSRMRAPEPRPPLALRPRKLSVTRIERWIANPYAIFARRILKLEALPPLGPTPTRRCAAASCTSAWPVCRKLSRASCRPIRRPNCSGSPVTCWPTRPDIRASPLSGCRASSASRTGSPTPSQGAGARRDAHRRRGRRQARRSPAPAGPFTLTARADRIDIERKRSSSSPTTRPGNAADRPSASTTGEAPQLPLEAAIAMAEAGFAGISPGAVTELRYIRASGGEPPGEERHVERRRRGARRGSGRAAWPGSSRTSTTPATPYRALRRARFNYATTTTRIWPASRSGRPRRSTTRRARAMTVLETSFDINAALRHTTQPGGRRRSAAPRPGSAPTPAPARRTC